jgi:hypothetical protein
VEVLQRVKVARQSHYLAVRRAGEWPRGRAEQLRNEYLCRGWRVLLAEGAVFLAFTPLALLAPTWVRDFIVGGWTVFVGWFLWHQVVVESGSSTRDMGGLAEQWTSNDLKVLRRRGWRVINHVVLRRWDIDHVAIGPGGLLVVQTKWSSDEAAMRDLTSVTAGLRADAEDVRLMLKARLGSAPTRAVVVVWGPAARRESALPSEAVAGVHIVAGRHLASLLKSFDGHGVDAEAVDGAWETLSKHVERRDARDVSLSGPAPRSLQSRLGGVLLVIFVAALGVEASVLGLRWLHLPTCLAVVAGEAAIGLLAARVGRLRILALVCLTAVAAFWLLIAAAEIYTALS